jgi:hypothetical protein
MAALLQLMPQVEEVINLPVEDDPDRFVLIGHGLSGRSREVDDLQPAMPQEDRRRRLRRRCLQHYPAAVVRTAMPEEVHHTLAHAHVHWLSMQVEHAADTAHGQRLLDSFGKPIDVLAELFGLQPRRTIAIVMP